MKSYIFILFLATLIACHHSEKHPEKLPEYFDYGKIANGIYSNNYFDFELPIPDNYNVENKEKMMQDSGSQTKTSEVTSPLLLNIRGSADEIHKPSLSISADKLSALTREVSSGSDYLDYTTSVMGKIRGWYSDRKGYRSENIGDKKFDVMDATLGGDNNSYLVMIDKGFALLIILTYADDKQKQELMGILNGVKFK